MAYQPQVVRIPEALTPPSFQRGKLLKSLAESASIRPTKPASPRVNDVVSRLQAQLAGLTKAVEMLKANQRKSPSPFDGAFTRNPEKSLVQKSATASIFDGAYSPRDLTEIAKNVEREGFWPLRLTHEPQERSVVVKSSVLDPLEHEEIGIPLKKSSDTNIFAGAFARL
jgi:hypothetical protein